MTRTDWLAVGVLLLATALVAPWLAADPLTFDEVRSLVASGAGFHGPTSYPLGVWGRVAAQSPDQALGFPFVVYPWVALVGTSELALRWLPTLAGLLTVALVYRTGRELFSPSAGLAAALVLATSVLYLAYMHKFRVFTLVSLAVALTLWGYWRLALRPRPPGMLARAAFVVGGIGLFYGHYFTTPLVAALGLFHLARPPYDRRWWSVVGTALVPIAVFALEVPVILRGLAFNSGRSHLHELSLPPLGVINGVATYFSNGYPWLLVVLLAVAVWGGWRQRRVWWLLVAVVGMVTAYVAMNEIVNLFLLRRIRYALGLWVPLALLVGYAMTVTGTRWRWLTPLLMVGWAGLGITATVSGALMDFDSGDDRIFPDWRQVVDPVRAASDPGDVTLLVGRHSDRQWHYTHGIDPLPVFKSDMDTGYLPLMVEDALRVWLIEERTTSVNGRDEMARAYLDEQQYTVCDTLYDAWDFRLTLYAAAPTFCPSDTQTADFGGLLVLGDWAVTGEDDSVTVNLNWRISEDMTPWTYSAAVYLLDDQNAVVAQADIGFDGADGPQTPMRAVLTPPDDAAYTVAVTVYAWETGAKLPVAALMDDVTVQGDLLLLDDSC